MLEQYIQNILNIFIIFAILSIIIERSLYQIFDTKLWSYFEKEIIQKKYDVHFIDPKPWISVGVSFSIIFYFNLDVIILLLTPLKGDISSTFLTLILSGLFISGGSTGMYKFLKKVRKLRELSIEVKKEKLKCN